MFFLIGYFYGKHELMKYSQHELDRNTVVGVVNVYSRYLMNSHDRYRSTPQGVPLDGYRLRTY